MQKTGLYIVIEGVDGAGKDTQLELIKTLLPEDTVYTREPRGTDIGVMLRNIITDNVLEPKTETLLFYAARNELAHDVIQPALEAGKIVVSNRNELTTYAYQISAREREDLLPLVEYLSESVLGDVKPDLCIYFDISAETRKERMQKRSEQINSFDTFDEGFFDRAREGYKKYIARYPRYEIIDSTGPKEEVFVKVREVIIDFLKEYGHA